MKQHIHLQSSNRVATSRACFQVRLWCVLIVFTGCSVSLPIFGDDLTPEGRDKLVKAWESTVKQNGAPVRIHVWYLSRGSRSLSPLSSTDLQTIIKAHSSSEAEEFRKQFALNVSTKSAKNAAEWQDVELTVTNNVTRVESKDSVRLISETEVFLPVE